MIAEYVDLIKRGEVSPCEIVGDVLKKIEKEDGEINAFITVASDAKEQAKKSEKDKTGRLCGIPIAIKDNICAQGLRCTAGSKMLENYISPYDATVVKKLKDEGCVIIGKTNMDEFGMGSGGKNSAFGQSKNPINTLYVPGGSSSGSAASVRGGMAFASLGTDTGGSLRQPASFCGLYALKPTYATVSRYGLIAFASSLDVVGTMATSVRDVALVTDVIMGGDEFDATLIKKEKSNFYDKLKPNVKELKIGVPKELLSSANGRVKECVCNAIKRFETMGAKIEECSFPSVKYAVSAYYMISSAEASSNLARYDSVRYGYRASEYSTFEEMCAKSRSEAFGDEVKRRILAGTFVLSYGNYDMYYKRAQSARALITKEAEELMEKYDVLISPIYPVGVPKTSESIDLEESYKRDLCTASVSLTGLPAMSVPCGVDENGMPVGMQIIGRRFSEQTLLDTALAYEEEWGDV